MNKYIVLGIGLALSTQFLTAANEDLLLEQRLKGGIEASLQCLNANLSSENLETLASVVMNFSKGMDKDQQDFLVIYLGRLSKESNAVGFFHGNVALIKSQFKPTEIVDFIKSLYSDKVPSSQWEFEMRKAFEMKKSTRQRLEEDGTPEPYLDRLTDIFEQLSEGMKFEQIKALHLCEKHDVAHHSEETVRFFSAENIDLIKDIKVPERLALLEELSDTPYQLRQEVLIRKLNPHHEESTNEEKIETLRIELIDNPGQYLDDSGIAAKIGGIEVSEYQKVYPNLRKLPIDQCVSQLEAILVPAYQKSIFTGVVEVISRDMNASQKDSLKLLLMRLRHQPDNVALVAIKETCERYMNTVAPEKRLRFIEESFGGSDGWNEKLFTQKVLKHMGIGTAH